MVRKWFVLSIPGVRRINHCAVAEPQKQTQTASFLRSKMVGGRADGLLGGGGGIGGKGRRRRGCSFISLTSERVACNNQLSKYFLHLKTKTEKRFIPLLLFKEARDRENTFCINWVLTSLLRLSNCPFNTPFNTPPPCLLVSCKLLKVLLFWHLFFYRPLHLNLSVKGEDGKKTSYDIFIYYIERISYKLLLKLHLIYCWIIWLVYSFLTNTPGCISK